MWFSIILKLFINYVSQDFEDFINPGSTPTSARSEYSDYKMWKIEMQNRALEILHCYHPHLLSAAQLAEAIPIPMSTRQELFVKTHPGLKEMVLKIFCMFTHY